jgi:GntR family histidine utilization transcriptional repressor
LTRKRPLYQIVKDALKQQIETAVYKAGDRLPGEEAIAQDYNCSRLTAHRALRELAAEGYVERKRRAGTRVLPRDSGGVLIAIPSIKDEIEGMGKSYRYELLRRRVIIPPEHIMRALQTHADQKLLNIRCRHWANRKVLQYEDRWINPATAKGALDRSFKTTSPNLWLLTHVPYSDVSHEITSVTASAKQAEVLGLAKGDALLQVKRRTSFHGAGVTTVTLLHPGNDYVLRSDPTDASLGS